ncbi:hypothetical protein COBT_000675 [Conglomerata obtusa]
MHFLDNLHNIASQKDKILATLQSSRCTIIKGPTGCGKSTYIPYILSNESVILVEPRRIAVTSLYHTLKNKIENLSYKMRFESHTCNKIKKLQIKCTCRRKNKEKDKFKIINQIKHANEVNDKQNEKNYEKNYSAMDYFEDREIKNENADVINANTMHFKLEVTGNSFENKCKFCVKRLNKKHVQIMTDGMFLNMLKHGEWPKYIIIDEVHERSVRTDIILGLLKKHSQSKIILMSATINTKILEKYFDATVIEIPGQNFKAEIYYENVDDYVTASFFKVKEIIYDNIDKASNDNINNNLKKNEDFIDEIFAEKNIANETKNYACGDILVFLPGEEDINELYKLVKKIPQAKPYKIYSSLSDKKQTQIFEKSKFIKVILSTNICETSITIPGIKYVIDCGLVKEKIYNGINFLGIRKIGKDNADQRKGRCNRTEDGICYRLYSKETYIKMKYSRPEIEKCDLVDVLLYLLSYNINIFNFNYINYPNIQNVKKALKYLYFIKAIKFNNELTPFKKINITNYGKKILKNSFDVNLSHFFEITKQNKLENLGAMLISLISVENINFLDLNKKKYKSDIEALICLFKDFCIDKLHENNQIKENIEETVLRSLEKAYKIYSHIVNAKINMNYSEKDIILLEKVFSTAFTYNVSNKELNGSYKGQVENVYIHPSSIFFKKNLKKIVYVNVWCTNKNYARIVGKYYE